MMDLYKDILAEVLSKGQIRIVFENIDITNANDIVEMVCYNAIKQIKTILNNEQLDDFECVENIVCLLESIGSGGGSRHDF